MNKLSIQYYPGHYNPLNHKWFYACWDKLDVGGLLFTGAGIYVKTATGFVQA